MSCAFIGQHALSKSVAIDNERCQIQPEANMSLRSGSFRRHRLACALALALGTACGGAASNPVHASNPMGSWSLGNAGMNLPPTASSASGTGVVPDAAGVAGVASTAGASGSVTASAGTSPDTTVADAGVAAAGTRSMAAGQSGGGAGADAAGAGAGSAGAPPASADAGTDSSTTPPTTDANDRDPNGPCRDLELFCFDIFDMFIFNPECFTCNNGMGCASCENFQAI